MYVSIIKEFGLSVLAFKKISPHLLSAHYCSFKILFSKIRRHINKYYSHQI